MTERIYRPRPVYTRARAAADAELKRMVADGSMTAGAALAMATEGFPTAVRILGELHASGVSGHCITLAFENELRTAQAAKDQRLINAGEFTLAVWGGMQDDLAAARLKENGVQLR